MSSAEKALKKEINFTNKKIQELMLISSNAIADGKEKWKFENEWYNQNKAQIVLNGMRFDCNQLIRQLTILRFKY